MYEQHGDRMPAAVVSGPLSLRHPSSLSMTSLPLEVSFILLRVLPMPTCTFVAHFSTEIYRATPFTESVDSGGEKKHDFNLISSCL